MIIMTAPVAMMTPVATNPFDFSFCEIVVEDHEELKALFSGNLFYYRTCVTIVSV